MALEFNIMTLKVHHTLLVVSLFTCLHKTHASKCYQPDTVDYSIRQVYLDQPIFGTFLPKTPENQLLDNICNTLFPLPDDPSTFIIYVSYVYCDGSSNIMSYIATDVGKGQRILATPMQTLQENVIGYAGCDTFVLYYCFEFGGDPGSSYVVGISPKCQPIGLSCLRKVQEILSDRCLPDEDFYVLPMKLPNRCVTQQLCLQPPNPFYNKLPSVTLF